MIKVGIVGSENSVAGELIRILINHPDVDIQALVAPRYKGMGAESVHHGLVGERRLVFTDQADFSKLDFLFILDPGLDLSSLPDQLKWVDMSGRKYSEMPEDVVYGLSEAFRKPLVRGARHAFLPNPVASAALIALNPLALNLLISGDVKVESSLPDSIIKTGAIPLLEGASDEIKAVLPQIQTSFSGEVACGAPEDSCSQRAMRVSVTVRCGMDIADLMPVFEKVYDDHNFTFMTTTRMENKEVEGTHKCLLRLSRPDFFTLKIEALADPSMRGGAGEAVHLMNLLCGLYEKTGLSLKVSSL